MKKLEESCIDHTWDDGKKGYIVDEEYMQAAIDTLLKEYTGEKQ